MRAAAYVAGTTLCLLLLPPVLLMLAWSISACTEDECTTYWGGALFMLAIAAGLMAGAGLQLRSLARLFGSRSTPNPTQEPPRK